MKVTPQRLLCVVSTPFPSPIPVCAALACCVWTVMRADTEALTRTSLLCAAGGGVAAGHARCGACTPLWPDLAAHQASFAYLLFCVHSTLHAVCDRHDYKSADTGTLTSEPCAEGGGAAVLQTPAQAFCSVNGSCSLGPRHPRRALDPAVWIPPPPPGPAGVPLQYRCGTHGAHAGRSGNAAPALLLTRTPTQIPVSAAAHSVD
jgi:hypothetical protein